MSALDSDKGDNKEIMNRINEMLDNKLDLSFTDKDREQTRPEQGTREQPPGGGRSVAAGVEKEQGDTTTEENSSSYLQALLGLTVGPEAAPPGVLKASSTAKSQVGSSRPRSVSFSSPEVRDGFSRFVGAAPGPNRPHASESGSPTLEQALLMGRHSPSSDAGYGSYTSQQSSEFRSFADFTRAISASRPRNGASAPSSEPRPTLTSITELDIAVAQAVQNLQIAQEKRAMAYGDLDPAVMPGQTASNSNDDNNNLLSSLLSQQFQNYNNYTEPMSLERAARMYRTAAAVNDANCTWSGQLPPRSISAGRNQNYSSKIFLGGVPWDITEQALVQSFCEFGPVRVEWPGRDATSPPRGYLYLIFEDEGSVKELLARCTHDYSNGGSYYYKISSRRMRSKEVQIIPWVVADSNYVRCPSPRLDPQKTVFVGALHGMINSEGLAIIFNDLFGGVVYAGLDTDKHKYPIGSGRVTFNNGKSYMKAVAAAFIEIKTPRFSKKVQVDPYLEDALCATCGIKQGPYFCRDLSCFNYFCRGCWQLHHQYRPHHKPLMRNIRGFNRARQEQANFRSDMRPGLTTDFRPMAGNVRFVNNDYRPPPTFTRVVTTEANRAGNNRGGFDPVKENAVDRPDGLTLEDFLQNVLRKSAEEIRENSNSGQEKTNETKEADKE